MQWTFFLRIKKINNSLAVIILYLYNFWFHNYKMYTSFIYIHLSICDFFCCKSDFFPPEVEY